MILEQEKEFKTLDMINIINNIVAIFNKWYRTDIMIYFF